MLSLLVKNQKSFYWKQGCEYQLLYDKLNLDIKQLNLETIAGEDGNADERATVARGDCGDLQARRTQKPRSSCETRREWRRLQ